MKKILRKLFFVAGILAVIFSVLAFSSHIDFNEGLNRNRFVQTNERGTLRIMFYNAENLFDTENDPLINDEEFLPEGTRFWSPNRFRQKLISTYKVIAAAGGWEAPDVIGLSEVENRYVLNALKERTPLANIPYKTIHRNSPDRRGIDVALMYRSDRMTVIDSAFFTINFPTDPELKTREILYAKGLVRSDTLHFFVNHWPSRLGGAQAEQNRFLSGKLLRTKIDSLFQINPFAKIIIMGDFNDEPHDRSLAEGLGALTVEGNSHGELYNLMTPIKHTSLFGTYKFQGGWSFIDQIIVSGSLLNENNGFFTNYGAAGIVMDDFLFVEDEVYSGKRPFRTFEGYRYAGGFSDHLPIILDLWIAE